MVPRSRGFNFFARKFIIAQTTSSAYTNDTTIFNIVMLFVTRKCLSFFVLNSRNYFPRKVQTNHFKEPTFYLFVHTSEVHIDSGSSKLEIICNTPRSSHTIKYADAQVLYCTSPFSNFVVLAFREHVKYFA